LAAEVAISQRVDGKSKIILAYGSIGDVFATAALLDTYVTTNGPTVIWCAFQHTKILERFRANKNFILRPISDKRCQRILRSWVSIENKKLFTNFISEINPSNLIIVGNITSNKKINKLYWEGRISYLDALRSIYSLQGDTKPQPPIYSPIDHIKLNEIFTAVGQNLKEIAIINPICYTHANISRSSWNSIAQAISAIGYTVAFNIMGNMGATDDVGDLLPEGFKVVKVPADLLPLAGSQAGLVCGRPGGGFYLLQTILRSRRGLLIILDQESKVGGRVKDPEPLAFIKECEDFYGNRIEHCAVLGLNDPTDLVYSKVSNALRVIV
jgi:hypothetical protein